MDRCARCKPDIEYPCHWQYRLIGEERTTILQAIQTVVNLETCTVSDGNVSSGGRYVSISVEVMVTSEENRLDLYNRFAADPAIRMVL